jgi:hypothetical protein
MMSSIKRQHTPSPSRTSSPAGTPKAQRVSAPVRSPLLCTLPPTCNLPNHATPLLDTRALEAHYAAYHAHVCSSLGCGCVFPDAHMLGLVHSCIPIPAIPFTYPDLLQHITECHDPLAALHSERGDKIVSISVIFSYPFSLSSLRTDTRLFSPDPIVRLPFVFLPSRVRKPKSEKTAPYLRARVPKGILLCHHQQGHRRLAAPLGRGRQSAPRAVAPAR